MSFDSDPSQGNSMEMNIFRLTQYTKFCKIAKRRGRILLKYPIQSSISFQVLE